MVTLLGAIGFGSGSVDADGRALWIVAQMPPGGLELVDIQLLDEEGVNVFDLYCFEEFGGYAQYLPGYRCEGLVDGTYTMVVGERPDGWIVSPPDCYPGVPEVIDTFTVVDGWGAPGTCALVATPPVLLLHVSDETGVVEGARFEVRDADGTPVELRCEPETRVGFQGDWCYDLPFGDLDVSLAGPFEGYRSAVYCDPELDTSGYSDQYGPSLTLSPDRWYWSCVGQIVSPITIVFQDEGGDPLAPDDIGFTVKSPDGDVTDACVEVTVPFETDGPGASIRRFHCLGLGRGSYLVEPDSDRVWADHCVADVGPDYWGTCEFYLAPKLEPPAVVEPSATTTTIETATTATAEPDTSEPGTSEPGTSVAAEADGGNDDSSAGGWLVAFLAGLLGGVIGAAVVVVLIGRRRS